VRAWLLKISEPIPFTSNVNKGRTAMLADELAARGHEVVWWVSSFDHQKKRMILPDNVETSLGPSIMARSVRGTPYRNNVSLRRYLDHGIIARKFRERAPHLLPPDVIVAAMPDHQLAWEAVAYARRRNIPIVVDIRDPWPDAILDRVPPAVAPLLRAGLFLDFRMLERTLKKADGITSMVTDWLEWGLAKAGRRQTWKDRVFYIGAPRENGILTGDVPRSLAPIFEQIRGKFVVGFISTFSQVYQPSVIVKAARLLRGSPELRDRIAFLLAGDGQYFAAVRKEAQGLDNVFLPGWVNREEMQAIHSISSVGIVPGNLVTEAFPNKAFGYLSAGLPILTSNDGDLPRMLAEFDAGYHFERGNERQLAELIAKIAASPERRASMAANAQRLFDEKLSAERIYVSFADHIEVVAGLRHTREHEADGSSGVKIRCAT